MTSDLERLARIIQASGLSARAFARLVLSRDERTIRRWLAGETMPRSIADWLDRLQQVRTTRTRVYVTVARTTRD